MQLGNQGPLLKVLVATVLFLLGSASRAADRWVCPAKYQGRAFTQLELFTGQPADGAQLKPDNGDEPLPHFWTFGGDDETYARCVYGKPGPSRKMRVHYRCVMEKAKRGEKVFRALSCE
jgi:hypothetical protein